jgi:hypothetical protein
MDYPASTQEIFSKPSLFSQLPDKAGCSSASLNDLFNGSKQVVLVLNSEIFIRGEITASVNQNASVKSVIIRLTDFPGANCTISRIRMEDGSVRYAGRMLSVSHSDAMLLAREKGKYFFVKAAQRLLMTE